MNAQNLILNSSFEEYSDCPTLNNQLFYLKNWTNPTKSSPDYFNSCNGDTLNNKTIVGVPYNFNGYKKAHRGNAYVGIVACSLDPKYREYIQTNITSKLIEGQQYQLSFWISISDSSNYESNGICFCFSNDFRLGTGDVNDGGIILSCQNKAVWIKLNNCKGTKDWVQITSTFIATGDEKYLTVGLFKENKKQLKMKKVRKVRKTYKPYAYYYIDDIELISR